MIHLVMFDLDGTIIDTKDDLAASLNVLRARWNLEAVGLDRAISWVGDGAPVLVTRALGIPDCEAGTNAEAARGLAFFREHYVDHMFDQARPYPGIAEVLDRLRGAGKTLVVVSNKPEAMCSDMLAHFGLDAAFAMVVGGDTLATRKPDPGPILHVLTKTGVPAQQALMVGDGTQDIRAGKAAGVTTVAALYGFRSREILEPTRPDHWIETIDELIELVSGRRASGAPME
jgi:phosphoglycolate phosphatase